MQSTGSLCPYRERKNLKESRKKMRTVASSSATASSFPLGLTRTHITSSVICSVLWNGVKCVCIQLDRSKHHSPIDIRAGQIAAFTVAQCTV